MLLEHGFILQKVLHNLLSSFRAWYTLMPLVISVILGVMLQWHPSFLGGIGVLCWSVSNENIKFKKMLKLIFFSRPFCHSIKLWSSAVFLFFFERFVCVYVFGFFWGVLFFFNYFFLTNLILLSIEINLKTYLMLDTEQLSGDAKIL